MPGRCAITGKAPRRGNKYTTRGVPKWKGGIGVKVTGKNKRWFRPNLQRVKVIDEHGRTKRIWVTASVIKKGLITKAPKQKILAQLRAEKAAAKGKK